MDWAVMFLSRDGRIARREFWFGFALVMIVSVIANLLPGWGKAVGFLALYAQVSLFAQRLHDMGRTAWLMAIPWGVVLLCTVGAVMTGVAGASDATFTLALALTVLAIVVGWGFVIWVGTAKGTPGPNRFGEPLPRIRAEMTERARKAG